MKPVVDMRMSYSTDLIFVKGPYVKRIFHYEALSLMMAK
jgi:hypothetical protein